MIGGKEVHDNLAVDEDSYDYINMPILKNISKILDEYGVGNSFEKIIEGKPTVRDIVSMYKLPLPLLGLISSTITRIISGRKVGYIVNMILNYTNICVVRCRFCAFYRKPSSRDGYRYSIDEVVRDVIDTWKKYRIRQVLIQGGVDPSIPLEYYEEVFRRIKSETRGEVAIHGLSVVEVYWIAKVNRMSIAEVISRLVEAGLDSLPGAGAEILSDRVRKLISPLKPSTSIWIDVMDTAMKLGVPISATMMYGHLETIEERAQHFLSLLELQRKRQRIMAFIAWNFEPGRTELEKTIPYPAGGSELLRNIAVSRIVFRHEIPWIQAGWLTAGEKLAQVSLAYGANDWGGTLYGEKVLPATGLPLPLLVRNRIENIIRSAGFIPFERDNWYRPVSN